MKDRRTAREERRRPSFCHSRADPQMTCSYSTYRPASAAAKAADRQAELIPPPDSSNVDGVRTDRHRTVLALLAQAAPRQIFSRSS